MTDRLCLGLWWGRSTPVVMEPTFEKNTFAFLAGSFFAREFFNFCRFIQNESLLSINANVKRVIANRDIGGGAIAPRCLVEERSDEVVPADPRAKKPLNVVAAWIGIMTFERDATFTARVGSERHAEQDVRTNL